MLPESLTNLQYEALFTAMSVNERIMTVIIMTLQNTIFFIYLSTALSQMNI